MKLWVDDERPAPDDTWTVAVSSVDAIWILSLVNDFEEVSLDHDLGGDDTGMKVLDWMIAYGPWPESLTIHTANPPARQRMLQAANAEAPESVSIYVITSHA